MILSNFEEVFAFLEYDRKELTKEERKRLKDALAYYKEYETNNRAT